MCLNIDPSSNTRATSLQPWSGLRVPPAEAPAGPALAQLQQLLPVCRTGNQMLAWACIKAPSSGLRALQLIC